MLPASDKFHLFGGTSNPSLVQGISEYLGVPVGKAKISTFPDGEIDLKIEEDVRGSDVFVIQSTCPPVNHNLMELLILIDCLKRASSARVTAVIPYFGYARQDRKDEGRVPITAKLVANLIAIAGASRVLTVDLHAPQIQGFFDIPVDHLYAAPVLVEHFKGRAIPNLVVVSPDVGSIKMARAYSKKLGGGLAIVDKRRVSPEEAESVHLIGDVGGKNVVIIDDMIATAGSVVEAVHCLKAAGAREISVGVTHAVLCGPAFDRLRSVPVTEIAVTDTIPLGGPASDGLGARIRVLSVAGLLGEAIRRIHRHESVSSLFV